MGVLFLKVVGIGKCKNVIGSFNYFSITSCNCLGFNWNNNENNSFNMFNEH